MIKIPKIMANGINLYYEIHGEGDPIVLIMGLSANSDWWTPEFLSELNKEFKTIIFDNRDAGRSDNSKNDYKIKTFAEDTIGLLDGLGIQKAHFLGISMGGMIAQEIALNYPKRVKKLILSSTNCGNPKSKLPSQEIIEMLSTSEIGKNPQEIVENFIPILFTESFIKNNPERLEEAKKSMLQAPIKRDAYSRQIKAILQFNSGRRLKRLEIPTLILHGQKDILIPPENAKILSNLIPNSELHYFEDTGHALFTHIPKKSANVIMEFIK